MFLNVIVHMFYYSEVFVMKINGQVLILAILFVVALVFASVSYYMYASQNAQLNNVTSSLKVVQTKLANVSSSASKLTAISDLAFNKTYTASLAGSNTNGYTLSHYVSYGEYYNCSSNSIVDGNFEYSYIQYNYSNPSNISNEYNITFNIPHSGYLILNTSHTQGKYVANNNYANYMNETTLSYYNSTLGTVYYPPCAHSAYYKMFPYNNYNNNYNTLNNNSQYFSTSTYLIAFERNATNLLNMNTSQYYNSNYGTSMGTYYIGGSSIIPVLNGKVTFSLYNYNQVPVNVKINVRYVPS